MVIKRNIIYTEQANRLLSLMYSVFANVILFGFVLFRF
jgi:hypothetical protein